MKILLIAPGIVTSWPRPMERARSPAGRVTDWAVACPAIGARLSGATAQAAVSREWIRRRFIVVPLETAPMARVAVLLEVVPVIALLPDRHFDGILAASDPDDGAPCAGRK